MQRLIAEHEWWLSECMLKRVERESDSLWVLRNKTRGRSLSLCRVTNQGSNDYLAVPLGRLSHTDRTTVLPLVTCNQAISKMYENDIPGLPLGFIGYSSVGSPLSFTYCIATWPFLFKLLSKCGSETVKRPSPWATQMPRTLSFMPRNHTSLSLFSLIFTALQRHSNLKAYKNESNMDIYSTYLYMWW